MDEQTGLYYDKNGIRVELVDNADDENESLKGKEEEPFEDIRS